MDFNGLRLGVVMDINGITGCSYTGDRVNGRMEGSGKYTFQDGQSFEGGFKDGM